MIHGYTKIELTNVHTGEVEVVEKHNLVTNAVQEFVNAELQNTGRYYTNGYNNLVSAIYPLYETIMGGIFLFQNTLTESEDNILFPYDNPLTGYASNDVNSGTNTDRGSRNLTESTLLDNGFRYVWDFTTAQANGTISAVALTHAQAGQDSVSSSDILMMEMGTKTTTSSDPLVSAIANIKEYDFDTNTLVGVYNDTFGQTVMIVTAKCHVNDLSITKTLGEIDLVDTTTVDISAAELNYNSSYKNSTWIEYDGYYYGVFSEYAYDSSTKTYSYWESLIRVDKSSKTYDTTYGKKKIPLESTSYYNAYGGILDGYLYLNTAQSVFGVKKINLQDVTEITDVTTSDTFQYNNEFRRMNGALLTPSGWCIRSDGSVQKLNFAHNNAICGSKGMCIRGTGYASSRIGYTYLWMHWLPNNLCTINNLDSPVQKTSDKTMKITYTITEE